MSSSPTARAASHLFWCTVLFVGLVVAILPRDAAAAPKRTPCHGVVISAAANLKLSPTPRARRSASEPEDRKCRPHHDAARSMLVADGVDPIDNPCYLELPSHALLLSAAQHRAAVCTGFASHCASARRSRSPPVW